jgi:hypothetical protein
VYSRVLVLERNRDDHGNWSSYLCFKFSLTMYFREGRNRKYYVGTGRCFCFDIIALVEYTAVMNRELFLLDFFSQEEYVHEGERR